MDSGSAGISPDEAFEILGQDTRLSILRAVWAADDPPVAFSDLRRAVGSPDSGRFNYHLNKLVGPFLTATDGGYSLTQGGRQVVRSVMAGTLTDAPAVEAAPIGAGCPTCDGALVVRYAEYGVIECDACGETVMWNEFPPAGLAERSTTEFARTFDRWVRRRFQLAADGICPNCAAAMTTTVEGVPTDPGAADPTTIASHHSCPNCRYEARVPLLGHALSHPAVIAFFWEAGRDLTAIPFWEWRTHGEDFSITVTETNPQRIRLAILADHGTLTLTVDADLTVVSVDRSGD